MVGVLANRVFGCICTNLANPSYFPEFCGDGNQELEIPGCVLRGNRLDSFAAEFDSGEASTSIPRSPNNFKRCLKIARKSEPVRGRGREIAQAFVRNNGKLFVLPGQQRTGRECISVATFQPLLSVREETTQT